MLCAAKKHVQTSVLTCISSGIKPRTLVSLALRHHAVTPNNFPFNRQESSLAHSFARVSSSKPAGATFARDSSPPLGSASPSDLPTFSTLEGSIADETLKALTKEPFRLTHMSPVQAEVLPLLPQIAEPFTSNDGPPRDILVRAKTGTGKTLAFLIPAVEARLKALQAYGEQVALDAGMKNDPSLISRARRAYASENVGTLIISPTRELASQIAEEAMRLTRHHPGFNVLMFTGGASRRDQMREWTRGRKDIVVGTPGRLRDVLDEPEVAKGFSKTQLLVLDEADTLLDMGFRDEIEAIQEFLPPTPRRQTFLFSATVSRKIQQIARSALDKNHMFINCVSDNSSPVHAHVNQYHTVLPTAAQQIPHILRLIAHDQLSNPGTSKIIVFLPTTKMTQLFMTVMRRLSNSTLPAGRQTQLYELHSKRPQSSRTATSDAFRSDRSGAAILVTSDVSARGVDYPGVTRVIQVGVPAGTEQYIHRVGRTGRAGTEGRGDLVLQPWEMGFISSQLSEVPLKPLTVTELEAQTKELASKFDEDPVAFFENAPMPKPNMDRNPRNRSTRGRGRPSEPHQLFNSPVQPLMAEVDRSVTETLQNLDQEAVEETFFSLLGFYTGHSEELRTPKKTILQGLKDWTTQACGLTIPPFVSERFLQTMRFSNDRNSPRRSSFDRSRSSRSGSGSSSGRPGSNPWTGRGSRRSEGSSYGGGRDAGSRESRPYGDRGGSSERRSSFGFGDSNGRESRGGFAERSSAGGSFERKFKRY